MAGWPEGSSPRGAWIEGSVRVAGHEEALLSANYTKKDRAAKQQALFPQLEEAIAEGRKTASTGVIWPDQRSAAYQKEVCDKADPLIHERITPQQRQRLFTRVLKPFSMVFWMMLRE